MSKLSGHGDRIKRKIISDATDSYYVTSLLTSTFNIIRDLESKDAVAAALMALNQSWRLYHRLIIVIFSLLCLWFPILPPLLYLLRVYLYNPSLLILLVIPSHQRREPVIPPRKPRDRTPAYSTSYYQSPLYIYKMISLIIPQWYYQQSGSQSNGANLQSKYPTIFAASQNSTANYSTSGSSWTYLCFPKPLMCTLFLEIIIP